MFHEPLPTPKGFEALFNRGKVQISRNGGRVDVLFTQSCDADHIIPIAWKIDSDLTYGSIEGDIVLHLGAERFEAYVSEMARASLGNTAGQQLTPEVR